MPIIIIKIIINILEDRFVKSLALSSTVLSLTLASALLGFGFCAVLGLRT